MTMKPALYVSRLLPMPVMEVLRQEFRLTAHPSQDHRPSRRELLDGLGEAEAAITTLTERMDDDTFAQAPRLKIVANCAVGFNNIALDAARSRGIVVTNTPDVLTEATADLTWALILASARRLVEGDRLVRSGTWSGWDPIQLLGGEVSGKIVGIIGMGRIGQAVARRASGFDMEVLYYGRSEPSAPMTGWHRVTLEKLLVESDFITLHLPLTSETHHLIGASELARMKPTAFLINTARGAVVDEAALVAALNERRLAGAGLDVYEDEPKIHPGLAALPQVVLLPHLGSATLQTRIKMGMICVENVRAVLAGRPAPNRVA